VRGCLVHLLNRVVGPTGFLYACIGLSGRPACGAALYSAGAREKGCAMKVLQVRADGSALVSTRGLRRIVDKISGKTIMEFVPCDNAREQAEFWNSMWPDGTSVAEAITYREAAKRDAARLTKKRATKLKLARVA